jgi:hypothetical protein
VKGGVFVLKALYGKKFRNRSEVQGSTFRVKDKENIEDPKPSSKCLFSQVIANLGTNFGLGMTKMTLFS